MSKKNLCQWDKKEINKNYDELSTLIGCSKYICTKCARSADSKEHLCKPKKSLK